MAVESKPAWLQALLSETFFNACSKHSSHKKNEVHIFCVDCIESICQHCLGGHMNHKLLQVRRYVYHDVIRLQDIQKLVDCSLVQTYIINSAKAVFLNQRPQARPPKGGLSNVCETCDRCLQDAYSFCSVACKVDSTVKQGKHLSAILRRCNSLQLSEDCSASRNKDNGGLEGDEEVDMEMSPNSILEEPESSEQSTSISCSWGSKSVHNNKESCAPRSSVYSNSAIPHPPKKVRSARHRPAAAAAAVLAFAACCRRKSSTPHRSPLC